MWKQHFKDQNIVFEIENDLKNDAIQNEVFLKIFRHGLDSQLPTQL